MKAIILAAGKGTRLNSEQADQPKALRRLCGKPLLWYVLDNLSFLAQEDIAIVVGFLGDQVRQEIGGAYHYVEQPKPYNGTARAAQAAQPVFGQAQGPVLVAYCDMPFLSRNTYQTMFDEHIRTGAGHTLLASIMDPPPPFGRLIRDSQGNLLDIVEESAATPEQRRITEVNVGLQVFDAARMWGWLERIDNDNPKREYYLTGAARVLAAEHVPQTVVHLEDETEVLGINTPEDLHLAEARMAALRPQA